MTNEYDNDGAGGVERDVPPISLTENLDDRLELVLDNLLRLARLALLKGLADAEDDREPGRDRGARLGGDLLRRLVEERAALGVACGAGADDQRDVDAWNGEDVCSPRMT